MSAHIHANLMKQYYEDALKTDKPWERWEHSNDGLSWFWCSGHPAWKDAAKYRRKPVALCQIEGRDVFPGDKLWHNEWRRWVIAKQGLTSPQHVIAASEDGGPTQAVVLSYLSWTAPPQMKTVYQWAFEQPDGRFCATSYFYATEEEARIKGVAADHRQVLRLDWTALEVPA